MKNDDQCRIFGPLSIGLSDEDVLAAMKSIPGYLDITPADFKEIYAFAYRHALERLGQSVTAKDIMTKTVISVNSDTSLVETARCMAENSISGLPVINEKQVAIGVISEKDFFQKMGANDSVSFMGVVVECLSNKGCLAMPIREKRAADIMTSPAITARLHTSISELSSILADNHINRIPVVSDEGKLLGIVSRGDLVDSFCAKVL
jgi:CBS-domain-containing membrane protein